MQVNYNGFHLLMNEWKDTQTFFVHGYLCEKLMWTKNCKIVIFVSCKGHEQTSFMDEWKITQTFCLSMGIFMRNWNG